MFLPPRISSWAVQPKQVTQAAFVSQSTLGSLHLTLHDGTSMRLPSTCMGSIDVFWQAINGTRRRLNIFQIWLTWEEMLVSINQKGHIFAGENFYQERSENQFSQRQSRHLK